ncbi:MAG: hypothetical protein IPL97_13445 [Niastella sp.]|nr:hypothetical protein [Niastella sp.]
MKKLSSILVVLFALAFNESRAQSSLDSQLRNFPIADYLNKPIDTLIAHLPAGYDTSFDIGSSGNINRGASLQINYPPNNQFWIDIFITDAQYITINKSLNTRPEDAWPLALLRKEKVGSITIYTGAYEIINEADIY